MRFSAIFKLYISISGGVGKFLPSVNLPQLLGKRALRAVPTDISFSDADGIATRLGNQYRSIGVLIGVLGILMVFLAIAPVAIGLDHEISSGFSIVRLILMLLVLVAVLWGQASSIKSDWIVYRRLAEGLRYKELADSLGKLEQGVPETGAVNEVEKQLKEILEGEYSQTKYNQFKAAQFTSIVRLGQYLVWFSFIACMVGVVGGLMLPAPEWLLLTAFVPAAVGGLHGINGFLGVGALAEQHLLMSRHLEQIKTELASLDGAANYVERLSTLGRATLDVLSTRDAQWENTASKIGLKPT